MMNDKMAMAITKAVGKEVEIKTAEQDEKSIIATAVAGDETYKAVLSERKNQYGVYYRVMSSEMIETKEEEPEDEPKDEIDEAEAIVCCLYCSTAEALTSPYWMMSGTTLEILLLNYRRRA